MAEFQAHSEKQEKALFFDTPMGLLACGIQFGKTRVGSVWMAIKNHKFIDPTDNFLIVAPTYKILTQSTLPPYLDIMKDRGTFNKADMCLKVHGGGTVYMRSGENPDSVVGITNVRGIWGDEAGLFGLYFSENLAARAAFKGAQILYTTSPYSMNWLYKDIILPKMRDAAARPDVTLIQAASWENPYFPKDVIERNRKTMDPKRFNAMFGGSWERMEGLVYDCWDDQENVCEQFTLPSSTRFVAGIDWGHTQPFVIKVRAITPNGMHYSVSEFYKTGLTISDMIDVCKSKKITWGIEKFYCGPDRPENIEELCRHGIPAIAARNDVLLGIDTHYQLIKSRRFKIFSGTAPYTMDELSKYHWPSPAELSQDKDDKERNPVKQDDHACLVGETKLATPRGIKRIDQIAIGDRVLTPFGYREVVKCGLTQIDTAVINKFGICCTPNHKIFDLRGDFIPASECLETIQWSTSFLTAISIFGTVAIGFIRGLLIGRTVGCTLMFGSTLLARRLAGDFTYITRMGINIITNFRTLNECPKMNIYRFMAKLCRMRQERSYAITLPGKGTKLQNGTKVPKEGNGIGSIPKNHENAVLTSYAPVVARHFKPRQLEANTARTIASRTLGGVLRLMRKLGIAKYAGKSFTLIDISGKLPVVSSAPPQAGLKADVYNLKVDIGCFFANGILVSNCDADRYISIMTANFDSEKRKARTPAEQTKVDTQEMMERLKTKRRPAERTENWS